MASMGTASAVASLKSTKATTTSTRTKTIDEASTTASAAGRSMAGFPFERDDMASVTAVEETRPPTNPVTVRPRSGPSSRVAA